MHFCFVFLWLLKPLFPGENLHPPDNGKNQINSHCQRFSADAELGVEVKVHMLAGQCGEHAGSGTIHRGGREPWTGLRQALCSWKPVLCLSLPGWVLLQRSRCLGQGHSTYLGLFYLWQGLAD